ncbi:MAG TPA: DUF397 domain-containing protein [Pseudonocardiaceae bacterium]|jgi:hypothetical protein
MNNHGVEGPPVWRKASYSNGNGGCCVEVADLHGGYRAVRDSKDPAGPMLIFTAGEWTAFTAGVRDDEFN